MLNQASSDFLNFLGLHNGGGRRGDGNETEEEDELERLLRELQESGSMRGKRHVGLRESFEFDRGCEMTERRGEKVYLKG